MGRAPSLCGVILAAGDSTRMGTDKALLPWPPVLPGQPPLGTFLSAAIHSLSPSSEVVIVVGGRNSDRIAPFVYATGASLVVNPEPERGQFSSLQVGLREVLNRGRDAALVTLVDRPPVSVDTVSQLCTAFSSALERWKWAVVPEIGGQHGHPIVLGREMIEAFLKAPPTANAREVEHQHAEHIEYAPVDDPAITINVNTPEEYAALRARQPAPAGD
jgi:molybdenum cofactor cytidylyltransferase